MNIFQTIKEYDMLYGLLCVFVATLIFRFSGGIVSSVFECGKELGKAIGSTLLK